MPSFWYTTAEIKADTDRSMLSGASPCRSSMSTCALLLRLKDSHCDLSRRLTLPYWTSHDKV